MRTTTNNGRIAVVANEPSVVANPSSVVKAVVANPASQEQAVVANEKPVVANCTDITPHLPPQTSVVANSSPPVVAVVANDEADHEDGVVVTLPPSPTRIARVEIFKRQRTDGTTYFWRWRWQLKQANGRPLRTANGGYKRGSRYGGKLRNKAQIETIKARSHSPGRSGYAASLG